MAIDEMPASRGRQVFRVNNFVRVFVLSLVVLMVLGEVIASIWSAIDWGLVLDLLPDWLVPDVLQERAAELEAKPQVPAPAAECSVMLDGTLICPDGVRFHEMKVEQ